MKKASDVPPELREAHRDGAHRRSSPRLPQASMNGTTFRRAVEEGLLDCERVVQIGLRVQGYTADDFIHRCPAPTCFMKCCACRRA